MLERALTRTERNWMTAVALAFAAGGCVAIWGLLERKALPEMPHVVRSAAQATQLLLGISHFLVAFLFLATSRRMRAPGAVGRLVWLALAAIGLCSGYVFLRQASAGLASLALMSYFVVHDLRDQVFFYRANGDLDATRDPPGLDAALLGIPMAFVGLAFLIAGLLFAFHLVDWTPPPGDRIAQFLSAHRGATFVGPIVLATAMLLSARRRWAQPGLRPRDLYRDHLPVVRVLLGIVVLLGTVAVTSRGAWIVSVHVTAWYVFSVSLLRRRTSVGAEPRPRTWAWWRTTLPGFRTVHLGALALTIGLAAYWSYALGQAPGSPLAWLVSREAFPLWTIAHVTVSFSPR